MVHLMGLQSLGMLQEAKLKHVSSESWRSLIEVFLSKTRRNNQV